MGSYTAAVVTDGVLLSTAMSSRQLLLVTALCASLVHSKILRSSIVRGQGFAAPPPGHTLNISPLQQQEAPRQQQAVSHFSQPRKPVKARENLDLSYLQIIVAFFRSSPNLTDQEVSSQ